MLTEEALVELGLLTLPQSKSPSTQTKNRVRFTFNVIVAIPLLAPKLGILRTTPIKISTRPISQKFCVLALFG